MNTFPFTSQMKQLIKKLRSIFLIKESLKSNNNLSESVSSHSKIIDILDTEYATILAVNPKEASFLVQHISMYRTAISSSLKDILLYRIGAYMRLFSVEDKRIEDIISEQHNWRLTQEQRQKVIQFLAEQFDVILES